MIGSIIGKYEIVSEIGRGGMGIVYKGIQKSLNRHVAIKVLPPQMASDKDSVNRFIQEANLIAKLNHENIVQIYDIEEKEGAYYIIMEYLEGNSLDKIINSSSSDIKNDDLISYIKKVCEALECTHQHGIIHRDVKSANIFITNEGKVKLMDFGISKITSSTTHTMAAIGTPSYMSPEQAKGEHLEPSSDIYSLGVILYECLTKRLPFEGEDAFSVALKHINEQPLPPNKINPAISPYLTKCCIIALNKDKKSRFQSAKDFKDSLEGNLPLYLSNQFGTYEKIQKFLHALFDDKMYLPGMTIISFLIATLSYQQININITNENKSNKNPVIHEIQSTPLFFSTDNKESLTTESINSIKEPLEIIVSKETENDNISLNEKKEEETISEEIIIIEKPEEIDKNHIEHIKLLIETKKFQEASDLIFEFEKKFKNSESLIKVSEYFNIEKEKFDTMQKIDECMSANFFDDAFKYINYLCQTYPNDIAFSYKKDIIKSEKQKYERYKILLEKLKILKQNNDFDELLIQSKAFISEFPNDKEGKELIEFSNNIILEKERKKISDGVLEKAKEIFRLNEPKTALDLILTRLKDDNKNIELLELKNKIEEFIKQQDFINQLKNEEQEICRKVQNLSESFSSKNIEQYMKLLHPEYKSLRDEEKNSTLNLFSIVKDLFSNIQIISFKSENETTEVSVFWKLDASFTYSRKTYNLFEKQLKIVYEKYNNDWYIRKFTWVM